MGVVDFESAQPPDPNHEPTEGAVPSEQRRNSDSDHKADTKWRDFPRARWLVLLYVVFLVWRVTSLTLYGVYSTECFFRAKLATLRCENFTLFPSPTTVEIAWQLSSSLNCLVALLVLVKLPPAHTPGLRAILRRLVQMARFWSLLAQLMIVVIYNTILFFHEHLIESSLIELGFILDEISITAVVCLWNFVPAPRTIPVHGFLLCYYASIGVFFVENFYLFVLMSSQAALDVTGIHEFESRAKGLQALGIVLNATEATFYFAIMKFFWNKLFERTTDDLFAKETFWCWPFPYTLPSRVIRRAGLNPNARRRLRFLRYTLITEFASFRWTQNEPIRLCRSDRLCA